MRHANWRSAARVINSPKVMLGTSKLMGLGANDRQARAVGGRGRTTELRSAELRRIALALRAGISAQCRLSSPRYHVPAEFGGWQQSLFVHAISRECVSKKKFFINMLIRLANP